MEIAEVRQIVDRLIQNDWAISTLCFAAEKGILEQLSEPQTSSDVSEHSGVPVSLVECILDTLVALNLVQHNGDAYIADPGLLPMVKMPVKTFFLANLRSNILQCRDFIDSARKPAIDLGWYFTDPEILQSQGWASAATITLLFFEIFPKLSDLLPRMQSPSASFLDIGTGVGAIAITACRFLPDLHVVGLEPQDAPLAEARRNIAAAGLTNRIELRQQYIEDMEDREAFDLAFFPQVFMPEDVVKRGLNNIWRALRPGGWVLVATLCLPGMELQAAISRLTSTLMGGNTRFPSQVQNLVSEANFISLGTYPLSIAAVVNIIAGQRPPE